MPEVVFAIRLTNEDWDEVMHGWRCPVLSVPGAIVEAVYVEGNRIDSARYEVLAQNTFLRWIAADHPQRVAVSIKLTEALSLGSETERWKRLAILLPVLATIVAAVITAGATYLSRRDAGVPYQTSDVRTPMGVEPGKGASNKSQIAEGEPNGPATDVIDSDNTRISSALAIKVGTTYLSRFLGDDSSRWFGIHQQNGAHDLDIQFSLVSPATDVRPLLFIYDNNRTKLFSRYHQKDDGTVIKWAPPIMPGDYVLEVKPSTSTGEFAQFLLSVNAGDR